MFNWIITPNTWLSLITLIIIEIILGIDNIFFISLVVAKLPKKQQKTVSYIGLISAMLMRLILLFCIARLIKIYQPLFTISHYVFTMHNVILLLGGLFLITKSIIEISKLFRVNINEQNIPVYYSCLGTVFQIIFLDIIFSLDSVITAVGLSNNIAIMFTAIIISVIIMMYTAFKVAKFITHHVSVKILALVFLFLVGLILLLEGLTIHIPMGYVYFSLFFSVFVEFLKIIISNRKQNY
ncbi:MAG: TerC family protein [Candidatus Dasytiphilus stammeri]